MINLVESVNLTGLTEASLLEPFLKVQEAARSAERRLDTDLGRAPQGQYTTMT
jgi:hypothetical protein